MALGRLTVTSTDGWFGESLASARRGESAGFDALYNALGGPVTAFAESRGAVDAEGVTNDVFLDVFRRIDSFSGDFSGFRSWVFTIARHRLIDAHRREQRQPPIARDAVVEVELPSAELTALARLGDARVNELLSTLTHDQRDVIVLRIVADLSLAEVATIVDKPISAVKRLQARGLRRLQQEILRQGVSE